MHYVIFNCKKTSFLEFCFKLNEKDLGVSQNPSGYGKVETPHTGPPAKTRKKEGALCCFYLDIYKTVSEPSQRDMVGRFQRKNFLSY